MDISGFFQRWGWFLLLGAGAFVGAWLLFGRKNKANPTGSTAQLPGMSSQPGLNGQPVIEYVPTTGDSYTNINTNYQTDSGNVTNTINSNDNNRPPIPPIFWHPPVRPPILPPQPSPVPGGQPGNPPPVSPPQPVNPPPILPPPVQPPVRPPVPPPGPPQPPIHPGPPVPAHPYTSYTIKWGDTLSAIAKRNHTTWQILYNANKGTIDSWASKHHSPIPGGPWNNIFPGETINVPR